MPVVFFYYHLLRWVPTFDLFLLRSPPQFEFALGFNMFCYSFFQPDYDEVYLKCKKGLVPVTNFALTAVIVDVFISYLNGFRGYVFCYTISNVNQIYIIVLDLCFICNHTYSYFSFRDLQQVCVLYICRHQAFVRTSK